MVTSWRNYGTQRYSMIHNDTITASEITEVVTKIGK